MRGSATQASRTVTLPSVHRGPTSAVETLASADPKLPLPLGVRPLSANIWPPVRPGSQTARGRRSRDSRAGTAPGNPLSARAADTQSSWSTVPPTPWEEASNSDAKPSTATTWPPALQASLQEWDMAPSLLAQADVRRSSCLKGKLEQMQLSEFFDVHGGPHFQRLGLGLAAKQNREVGSAFGSRSDLHAHRVRCGPLSVLPEKEKGMIGNARTYLAAAEAVAQDAIAAQRRFQIYRSQVKEDERTRVADVEQRRVRHLFIEVPNFELFLPEQVNLKDLIPVDLGDDRETAAKHLVDRQNTNFADTRWVEGAQMGWLFTQSEVVALSKSLERWSASTRGANVPMGMCRPTFCRFVIDVELVDQKKVPYFWAVQLFDSVAQHVRCCPPNVHHAATAPLHLVANRWRLISVIDTIVRQHCEAITRYQILERIKETAKKFPPPEDYVLKKTKSSSLEEFMNENPPLETRTDPEEMQRQPDKEPDVRSPDVLIERDLACRERLLQSMLVEPEVLHLVCLFQEVFRRLFCCYANCEHHMEFPELLRFCADFYLAPQFATEDLLKSLYEGVCCFDVREKALDPDPPPSMNTQPQKSMFRKKASTIGRTSMLMKSIKKNATSSKSPTRHSIMGRLVSGSSEPSPSPSTSLVSSPSKGLAEAQRSGAEKKPSKGNVSYVAEFGVNAFIETIVKLAFIHLGFFGNSVQLCSSSYFKMTWLLAYLRHVMTHMHACIEKSAQAGAVLDDRVQAVKALEAVPVDLWARPPLSATELDMQLMLQPQPGPGNQKPPKRRLKFQSSAPRLRPARSTCEQVMEAWRRKWHRSMKESTVHNHKPSDVVKTSEIVGADSLRPAVEDSSSGEEEVYLGSLPSRGLSDRKSNISDVVHLQSQQASKAMFKPYIDLHSADGSEQGEHAQSSTAPQGLPLEDLFPIESGTGRSCFVEGECDLCGRQIFSPEDQKKAMDAKLLCFGNPYCRGCSVADALSFKEHPFSRLILGTKNGSEFKKLTAKPHVGKRMHSTFPPPPVCSGSDFETKVLKTLRPLDL